LLRSPESTPDGFIQTHREAPLVRRLHQLAISGVVKTCTQVISATDPKVPLSSKLPTVLSPRRWSAPLLARPAKPAELWQRTRALSAPRMDDDGQCPNDEIAQVRSGRAAARIRRSHRGGKSTVGIPRRSKRSELPIRRVGAKTRFQRVVNSIPRRNRASLATSIKSHQQTATRCWFPLSMARYQLTAVSVVCVAGHPRRFETIRAESP